MFTRRVAFVTCASYRNLAPSDILAAEILRKMGGKVVPVVWTETPGLAIDFEVVVLRSVWDYHLNITRFLEWVDAAAKRALVLNSPDVVRWNSDKRYLLDLEGAGVAVPRTLILEKGTTVDLQSMFRKHALRNAVLKPVVSASAYETYQVSEETLSPVQDLVNERLRSRALILQEFVPEILTEGEWSLMFFNGKYSHAVRKLPKSGDFRVQAEHGGSHRPGTPSVRVRALAQQVVEKFTAETLYARIDIVEAARSPLIMEVELIDPELFLTEEAMAQRFAQALVTKIA